jgi:hypothetical protein
MQALPLAPASPIDELGIHVHRSTRSLARFGPGEEIATTDPGEGREIDVRRVAHVCGAGWVVATNGQQKESSVLPCVSSSCSCSTSTGRNRCAWRHGPPVLSGPGSNRVAGSRARWRWAFAALAGSACGVWVAPRWRNKQAQQANRPPPAFFFLLPSSRSPEHKKTVGADTPLSIRPAPPFDWEGAWPNCRWLAAARGQPAPQAPPPCPHAAKKRSISVYVPPSLTHASTSAPPPIRNTGLYPPPHPSNHVDGRLPRG